MVVNPLTNGRIIGGLKDVLTKVFYDPSADSSIREISKKTRKELKNGHKKNK